MNIEKLDDLAVVKLLKQEDHDAWNYIFLHSALPVTKRYGIKQIMRDRNISQLDVYGLLYEEMIGCGRINTYSNKGSLLGWMKCYVYGLIHRFCKKNPYPVSDEKVSETLLSMKAPEPKTETREVAILCFRELWNENPLRAYVLWLKLYCNLSAREIKDLLKLSSEDNVNQLFSRALKDMKRLKRIYENE